MSTVALTPFPFTILSLLSWLIFRANVSENEVCLTANTLFVEKLVVKFTVSVLVAVLNSWLLSGFITYFALILITSGRKLMKSVILLLVSVYSRVKFPCESKRNESYGIELKVSFFVRELPILEPIT